MATWLVTGANRGIGLELARQLVARGDFVVGTARDPDGAGALRDLGARVVALEVTDADSVRQMSRGLDSTPIDVLVNNAGIGGPRGGIAQVDVAEAAHTLAVNALGPLRVTQALLPNLRAGSGKRILHVSSLMGSIADNGSGGAYAYRASKAALNMINKSLALELGPEGFVCVVLNPGWVRTQLGGERAPLAVADSVRGLLRVIDQLGADDNGRFLNHDGKHLPW